MCQLASKAFAVVLCSIESITIVTAYLAFGVSLFFVIKLASRDLKYWVPVESEILSRSVSFTFRLVAKAVTDFTGLMQMRHPYELGGLYYTTIMLMAPFVCLNFGFRYLAHVEDEEVKASLKYVFTSEQIYLGLGLLAIVQMCSFAIFMYILPSTHRKTSWSTQTGSKRICSNFLEQTDDSANLGVLNVRKSYYSPIEEEIKTWLNERLPVWISEEPKWFDDQKKATIPDDYVNDPEILMKIRGIEVGKIRERRRSSVGLISG